MAAAQYLYLSSLSSETAVAISITRTVEWIMSRSFVVMWFPGQQSTKKKL